MQIAIYFRIFCILYMQQKKSAEKILCAPAFFLSGFRVLALHAKVGCRRLEGQRQRQNVGVGANEFPLGILQRLFKGGAGLETHAPGIARILCAHDIDGGGIHLRNVAAGHHGKSMEGMEGVAEAVFADILLVGGEILAVAVHIRQRVAIVVLEHIIQLPEIRP